MVKALLRSSEVKVGACERLISTRALQAARKTGPAGPYLLLSMIFPSPHSGMAFVSRSRRETDLGFSTTSPAVGPGSYHSPSVRKEKFAVAPFNSTSRRHIFAAKDADALPGPGEHFVDAEVKKAPVSTSVFKSRTSRSDAFAGADSDCGPGSYSLPDQWQRKPPLKEIIPQSHSHIKWVKVASAPSVPTKAQSFGYEEGSNGELVMQRPPTPPAEVTHGSLPSFVDSKKGTALMKARTTFPRKQTSSQIPGPGPGSYELPVHISGGNLDMLRPSASFAAPTAKPQARGLNKASSIPVGRAKSAPSKDAGSKMPGPGTYELPGAIKVSKRPPHLQFFGSTAERLAGTHGQSWQTPGPGAYFQGRPTGLSLADVAALSSQRAHNAPFGSAAERFAGPDALLSASGRNENTPGPGSFDTSAQTIAAELKKKAHGRFGAFGSTASRFSADDMHRLAGSGPAGLSGDLVGHSPDARAGTEVSPASYNPVVDVHPDRLRQPKRPTAVFASRSRRQADGQVEQDVPPPGAYEVPSTFGKTNGGKFVSRSGRFVADTLERARLDVPGPGAYDPSDRRSGPLHLGVSSSIGSSSRFGGAQKDDVPGPGSHFMTSQWVKKSFNVTIDDATASGMPL